MCVSAPSLTPLARILGMQNKRREWKKKKKKLFTNLGQFKLWQMERYWIDETG